MTHKGNLYPMYAGSRFYSKLVLSFYDLVVFGFSNRFAWQCPTQLLRDFYTANASDNHLDVGVGTGYLLDACRFPSRHPRITILDLNRNSLHVTRRRIVRYRPRPCLADVLAPLPIKPATFNSIGLNYVLHCLPGSMVRKGEVLKQLKPLLREHGVLFGTTVLSHDVQPNRLARSLMSVYNGVGVFDNVYDDRHGLETILQAVFPDYSLHVIGCVAFFVGRA